MNKTITFLQGGLAGDTIASLHAVKKYCEKRNAKAHIILDCCGRGLTEVLSDDIATFVKQQTGGKMDFPKAVCQYLQPLIEAQDYIEGCEVWDGSTPLPKIDINLNGMRALFFNSNVVQDTNQNLQFMYDKLLDVPTTYEPWLAVQKTRELAKHICIARSTRYLSAHLWLSCRAKLFEEQAFLIGTPFEYEVWKNAFRSDILYMPTKDALEAAQLISGSELFIAPGTMHYWTAVGLQHPKIINEVGVDIPTTIYRGEHPNLAYIQGGRLFKRLI